MSGENGLVTLVLFTVIWYPTRIQQKIFNVLEISKSFSSYERLSNGLSLSFSLSLSLQIRNVYYCSYKKNTLKLVYNYVYIIEY